MIVIGDPFGDVVITDEDSDPSHRKRGQ